MAVPIWLATFGSGRRVFTKATLTTRGMAGRTSRLEVRRVLRGGAFRDDQGFVRCASRLHYYTFDRSGNYGFRVVVVASPVRLWPLVLWTLALWYL